MPRETLSENIKALRKMVRKYPGGTGMYYLLKLPDGQWGALWHAAMDDEDYATMVVRMNYSLVAKVDPDKLEVLRYIYQEEEEEERKNKFV